MQKILIAIGVLVLLAGLLWPWLGKVPWGRLPGDVVVERENFRFYFPLVTGIVISVVLTGVLWLIRR